MHQLSGENFPVALARWIFLIFCSTQWIFLIICFVRWFSPVIISDILTCLMDNSGFSSFSVNCFDLFICLVGFQIQRASDTGCHVLCWPWLYCFLFLFTTASSNNCCFYYPLIYNSKIKMLQFTNNVSKCPIVYVHIV